MESEQRVRLNNNQLRAIRHKEGPLLIIAGAGTGKTTVITERIKFLILSQKIKPSEILALTFTDKAAREMEERVDMIMPYGYTQMWISTFHSFCDRVLRQEGLHIGLDTRYKLMTEGQCIQFIKDHIFEFGLHYYKPYGNPNRFIVGLYQHFSRLQDEGVDSNKYLLWVEKQKLKGINKTKDSATKKDVEKWIELANAYRKYTELKVKNDKLDFGDLILKTLSLFKQRKNILREYQNKFKYILVDEFQDTNYVQNQLSILLSGEKKNITVTGDDDQSIYRFRGAAISNIIQFRRYFPQAEIVTLRKNYRSSQQILDSAYRLIQNNNPDRLEIVENINKKLESQIRVEDSEIKYYHFPKIEDEAVGVARKIKFLKTELNYQFKDIAILVRANNHFEPFGRALSRYSLPYQFLGPGKLLKQSEIVDLVAYLRVLYNFDDSISFYRVLSQDVFDINSRDIAKLGNFAKKNNLSLFEACEKVDEVNVADDTKRKVVDITNLVKRHLKLLKKNTPGQVLYYYLQDTGLLVRLLNPANIRVEEAALNVSKFFDKIKQFETDNEQVNITTLVDWLDLSSDVGESPLAANQDWNDINAVNILTVHSSKGLEFPVVFLVNLVEQRFPTTERREQIPIPDELIEEVLPQGDYHLEEERRLFYVGMTRAKEKLYLTSSDYYGEGKRLKKKSPFINEALGDEIDGDKLDGSEQLSLVNYTLGEDNTIKAEIDPKVTTLSYSQIETFNICPLHYKLTYILNIPRPSSFAISFGISMHNAMKNFYERVQNESPTKNLLIGCYKESWLSEGYKNKKHEAIMYERGKKDLTLYFDKHYDDKTITVCTEKEFFIPLVSKDNKKLKIRGKIDRIDSLSKGKFEIIDYKTSERIISEKEVKKDLQMSIYALALSQIDEHPFPIPTDKLILSIYYFSQGIKVSTTRSMEDIERIKGEIFEWKRKIETSDFKCSGSILCESCDYKQFCHQDK